MAFALTKRFVAISLLFLFTTAGLLYAYMSYKAPISIQKNIVSALNSYTFQNITFERSYRNKGFLIFENIQLDEDAFSTIEKISVKYNVFNALFFGKIHTLKVHTPSITNTLNTNSLGNIQRYLMSGGLFHQKWLEKISHLEILDGKIDVLTQKYGGFRLNFDGQMRKGDDKSQNLQMNVSASQRQLSSSIRIKGQLIPKKGWHMDIALDRSRLDLPQIQLSRVNGSISSDGKENAYYSNGEINIGGFKIGELAWGDIAMTFEQSSDDGLKWIIAGNALGSSDVEFGLNYNERDSVNIHGTLYTKEMGQLLEYLNIHKDLSAFKNSNLSRISDIFVTYSLPFANIFTPEKSIIFNLKKIEENIEIKGNLSIDNDIFSIQSLLGPSILQDVRIAPNLLLKSGMLKGAITYNSKDDSGSLIASVDNGTIMLGALPLLDIQTNFKMDDLAELSMHDYQMASAALPLKKSILQDGSLLFKIKDNIVDLKDFRLAVFDGVIKSENILLPSIAAAEIVMNGSELSLDKISSSIGPEDLVSGNLKVSGSLMASSKKLIAKSLKLSSEKAGKIEMPDAMLASIFDQDNIETETMREALRNFRYEYFEIVINGDLSAKPTIKFTAKGRNTDILGGRIMTLNFETNKDLSPLWMALSKD